MRFRILCGAYVPSSPFIDGGCAFDWLISPIDLGGTLTCPNCGQSCHAEIVDCARVMLESRHVFVVGCPHRAFTFSRRSREPYFSPVETAEELRGAGGSDEEA